MMSETFFPAIVGALTAIFTSIVANWVSMRSIKAEYEKKHQMELIAKQFSACEDLWHALETASMKSMGSKCVFDSSLVYSKENAKELYDRLFAVFLSPAGLYFSRDLRKCFFRLTDFIGAEINAENNHGWSKTKIKTFDGMVQDLRVAIRHEMGLEDLTVTREIKS